MNKLTFNGNNLNPVTHKDNQIWLTSKELAKALGYADNRAVSGLYNKYSDEFTSRMTEVVNLATSSKTKGLRARIRIFSLRGCHLIAMFSRTKVAKDFRRWVLDILDNEVAPASRTRKDQRCPIHQAANLLMCKSHFNLPEIWEIVHQRFNVTSISEIPLEQIPDVVDHLHWLASTSDMASSQVASTMCVDVDTLTNTRALIIHTAWQLSFWWHIRDAIRTLSPNTYAIVSPHFANTSLCIYSLAHTFGVSIDKHKLKTKKW